MAYDYSEYPNGDPELTISHPSNAEFAYFDSLAWMTQAVQAYEMSISTKAGSTNINALNVARVCCGYALEFAYKAILYGQGKHPIKELASHILVDLHKEVEQPLRDTIESVGRCLFPRASADDASEAPGFIIGLAEHYTDPRHKYWMRPTHVMHGDHGWHGGMLPTGPFWNIMVVQRFHALVLDLCRQLIWPVDWWERNFDAVKTDPAQTSSLQLEQIDHTTCEWDHLSGPRATMGFEYSDLCDQCLLNLPDEEREEHITFVPPQRIITPPRRSNSNKAEQQ